MRLARFLGALCVLASIDGAAQATEATAFAHAQRIDPPQALSPLIFEDAAGQQHALADYRGRYVLLNVWASWCGPCVSEMPSLDALQQKFDTRKLQVLPLSEDRGGDAVAVFYGQHKIAHLPVAVDHAGIAPSALKLDGLPTTLLIDSQGREIMRVEGDENWASPQAIALLQAQMR